MKFHANISRELRAIDEFLPASKIKGFPILGYVKITTDPATRAVILQASTLSETIRFSITAEIEQPGECCYRARDLVEVLKKAKTRGHAVVWFDGPEVTVGDVTQKVKTEEASEFPNFPFTIASPDKMTDIDRADLARIADSVGYACSEDETRQVLTGVRFQEDETAATDGHRLVRLKMAFTVKDSFTFPYDALKRVAALLKKTDQHDRTVQIGLSDPSEILVSACTENTSLQVQVRSIEGLYPDYNRLIPPQFSKKILISQKQQWVDSLEEIEALSEPSETTANSSVVILSDFSDDGECILSGRALPIAGVRVSCRIIEDSKFHEKDRPLAPSKGEGYHISMESKYLREAIAACSEESVFISFNINTSMFVVNSLNDEVHLVMPIQLRNSDRLDLVKQFKPFFKAA